MAIGSSLISMNIETCLTQLPYLPHMDEVVISGWPQPSYACLQERSTLHSKAMAQKGPELPEGTASTPTINLDWARNRQVIVELYIKENLSMRDLIKTMIERYEFKATKRMYHTRFALWGIYKNTKADLKSQLAYNVIDAYRQDHELPILSSSEKRKLVRYARTSPTLGRENRAVLMQAIAKLTKPSESVDESKQYLTPVGDTSAVDTPFSDATSTATATTPSSSEASLVHRALYPLECPSPPPPLSFDRLAPNIELLLSCTHHYQEWQYTRSVPYFSEMNRKFWSDIKSGIYFLKIGSSQLAWPLLQDAGEKVFKLCESQPPSLLADLYATISPTNTLVCPQLRTQLLRLFAITARDMLGIKHPLSIICHQLQIDSEAEIPVRALRLMIDDLEARSPSKGLYLQRLQRTLITLLRRKNDYASATALVLSAISSSSRDLGADSIAARTAITEYVHILTDQKRWEEASPICLAVLESGKRDLRDAFPDERSVWAMEDMAEICGQLGAFDQASGWLKKALHGATKVWGFNHSTKHVAAKLERVQRLRPGNRPSDLFWK
jgi:hypothetical protein